MPAPFKPDVVCLADAVAKRAALAMSVVKLFKSTFTPTAATLVTDLDAAECDYDSYAPFTITAWLAATRAAVGGFQIAAPTVQFSIAVLQVVSNMVGGYWIELAAGDLVYVRQLDAPQVMANVGDAVKFDPNYIYPPGG